MPVSPQPLETSRRDSTGAPSEPTVLLYDRTAVSSHASELREVRAHRAEALVAARDRPPRSAARARRSSPAATRMDRTHQRRSFVGVAVMHAALSAANSKSAGSCSSAAARYDSSGRNITTNSGDGVNCAPVRLPAELDDVLAHLARELRDAAVRSSSVTVVRRTRPICGERRLRVDRRRSCRPGGARARRGGAPAPRRPPSSAARRSRSALHHPDELEDPSELDLAPAAARTCGCTERGDEVARLARASRSWSSRKAAARPRRASRRPPSARSRAAVTCVSDLPERLAERRDVRVELRLARSRKAPGALLHRRGRGCAALRRRRARRATHAPRRAAPRLDRAPLEAPRLDLELLARASALRRRIAAARGARREPPVTPSASPANQTDEQCDDRHEDQAT